MQVGSVKGKMLAGSRRQSRQNDFAWKRSEPSALRWAVLCRAFSALKWDREAGMYLADETEWPSGIG
jgi:hypothetical protein